MLACVVAPVGLEGQDALDDVARMDGTVAFEVRTKDDVRICTHGINRGSWRGGWRGDECTDGSVTVVMEVDGGEVRKVDHLRPGRPGPRPDRDLGWVSTEEAARFLLDLVPATHSEVAEDALHMAALVDSVVLWPDLERFAGNRELDEDVREAALFWLGQEAAEEAVRGITRVLEASDESVDIKEAAVFALSQRPDSVSVPLLMDVARSSDHPDVKESAFFWLSQKDDPRVLEFFLEVLRGQ